MVIVSVWDRSLPRATAVLATATTVSGVLLASLSQRRSAGKAADLGVGIALAMLANLSLQLRNVLNKRLMWLSPSAEASARGDAGRLLCEKGDIGPAEERRSSVGDADPEEQEQRMGGGDDGAGVPVGPMMPAELLLVSLTAALPMQLAIHAGCCGVSLMLRTAPSESRYAHYGDANPLWIIVPPLSFVAYQLASIGTLARVEPVLHAVLNAIKRIIVIGLGAALHISSLQNADISSHSHSATYRCALDARARLGRLRLRCHRRHRRSRRLCRQQPRLRLARSARTPRLRPRPRPCPPLRRVHLWRSRRDERSVAAAARNAHRAETSTPCARQISSTGARTSTIDRVDRDVFLIAPPAPRCMHPARECCSGPLCLRMRLALRPAPHSVFFELAFDVMKQSKADHTGFLFPRAI
mmetsp:Transcript_32710/g.96666  ORF Transcript_32710/g.96666 Transcript_32710/m.96666 type:complete len:413 (-) Transcript_32710:141-1379(-)